MKLRSVLAAAAAIGLAACGGSGGTTTTTQSSAQLPALNHHVTVNFWHAMAGGTQKPTLEAITKAFNESQTNVTVNLQVYDSYGTLRTKTLAALAAGTPPDMAQCYEGWADQYNKSKALADLTPYINAKDGLSSDDLKDYWQSLIDDGKLKGKQYMFPFNKSTYVIMYNPDAFKAAGISAPPATWDEFAADAKKLTTGGNWGTDFSQSGGYEVLWEAIDRDYGGSLLNKDQTKSAFNDSAGQQAIQIFADLVKGGYAHRVNGYDDETDLGSGHTAMIVQSIAGYPFVQQAAGKRFTVMTAPLPAGPKAQSSEISGTNACVFAKSAADVQQGAFQFIKYFTSKANTTQWSKATGYMPVRQSAFESMKTDYYTQNPNLRVAVEQLPKAFAGPAVAIWEDASNKILTELVNIVDGRKSAKQGLDDAAKQVDDLLANG